jgi:hypothetical protein
MSQMGPLRATLEKFAPEGYGKQSPARELRCDLLFW